MTVTRPFSSEPPDPSAYLAPRYNLPIAIVLLSIPTILFVQVWAGAIVLLFGIFLLVQAATIRLAFTDTALDVYRSNRQIRTFPYRDWQTWEIFWSPVPILFYFREVNSIHFLPVLFDPTALRACLEARCPRQA